MQIKKQGSAGCVEALLIATLPDGFRARDLLAVFGTARQFLGLGMDAFHE